MSFKNTGSNTLPTDSDNDRFSPDATKPSSSTSSRPHMMSSTELLHMFLHAQPHPTDTILCRNYLLAQSHDPASVEQAPQNTSVPGSQEVISTMSPMTLVRPSFPEDTSDYSSISPSPSFSSSTYEFHFGEVFATNNRAVLGNSHPPTTIFDILQQPSASVESFRQAFAGYSAVPTPLPVPARLISNPSLSIQPLHSSSSHPLSILTTLPHIHPSTYSPVTSMQDLTLDPSATTSTPSPHITFGPDQNFNSPVLTSLLNPPPIHPSKHRLRGFSIDSHVSSDLLWNQYRAKLLRAPAADLNDDLTPGLSDAFGDGLERGLERARLVTPGLNLVRRQRTLTLPICGVEDLGTSNVEVHIRSGMRGSSDGVGNNDRAMVGSEGLSSMKGGRVTMPTMRTTAIQTNAKSITTDTTLPECHQGEAFDNVNDVMQSNISDDTPSRRWSWHVYTGDESPSPLSSPHRDDVAQPSPSVHTRQLSTTSLGNNFMNAFDGMGDRHDQEEVADFVNGEGKRRSWSGNIYDDGVGGKKGKWGEKVLFYCKVDGCEKSYSRKVDLQTHLSVHNASLSRPHQCSFPGCAKSFTRKHDLERHAAVHTEDKIHRCDVCLMSFSRSDARKRHKDMGKCKGPVAMERRE